MKKLLNTFLALLMVGTVMAQALPDDLVISGVVLDTDGNLASGVQVCAYSDSISGFDYFGCTTTDSQGYYSLLVIGGSVSGPNVTFDVYPNINCINIPWQAVTVSNEQGTVDAVTADFITCSGNPIGNCDVTISVVGDSLNPNLFYLTAVGSGTAPYTYSWDNGSTTQTAQYITNGIFLWDGCVTVTDASGCTASACDTSWQNNGGGNCEAAITTVVDSTGGGVVYTLTASGTGVSPLTYDWWPNGETTQTINISSNGNPQGGIGACVTITDANGCVALACDTLGGVNNGGCQAEFYFYSDSLCMQPLECFQFLDQSVDANGNGAVSWFWDFGNNNTSTDQNPAFSFGEGTYYVCLTATMANGCSDTYCSVLTVGGGGSGNCDAGFTYGLSPATQDWMFNSNSFDQTLSYTWTLDGSMASTDMSFELGLTPGTHTVCLEVSSLLDSTCYDLQCETFDVVGGNCEGYISGIVNAGSPNFPLDEGMAYLITFDPQTNLLTAIDSMALDSGNYFFFGPVPCGDYLVKAAATSGSQYYAGHIPTYFGNSPFWDFAETITINQVNTFASVDITLIAGANPGGPGFIGGDVTEGANKFGDIGDPVDGATVLLFDNASNVIGYAYTDVNGDFGFSNLAWGTYQVYVEMLNKATTPVVITIGPDQPSFDGVHVLVFDTEITTGVEETEIVVNNTGLYPNPTNGNASIELTSEIPVQVVVDVRDLTGRTIITNSFNLNTGGNKLSFDVSTLSEGYYNVVFHNTDKGVSLTQKLIVVN